jgi:hypothetical protein
MIVVAWICEVCAVLELFADIGNVICKTADRLCSLVVRVPGYRPRGPGLNPGDTRFPGK